MTRKALLGFLVLASVLIGSVGLAGALTLEGKLGGLIYRDTNLSANSNQSCMSCHHPSAGFADPANRKDPVNFPVSDGSDPALFGGRNAPTSAYAGFSPVLKDSVAPDGTVIWSGGMFWDGRAAGWTLGDPLAEQAQGPFLNHLEMGLKEAADVVALVAASSYANLFLKVYPDTDFANVADTYNKIARAIAAFERSDAVTRFTSKFDQFYLACKAAGIDVSAIDLTTQLTTLPQGILTTRQLKGLALFNDKGNCAACHSTKEICDPKDPACTSKLPPLFTDFTYDNLGVPTNWRVYELFTEGRPPDLGLGGFLNLASEYGKFKVPSLRNVSVTPPYGHNGFFATLAGMVNFYNTRLVKPQCADPAATEAQALANGCWPAPDYPDTVNITELGNLGLTADEEFSLVVFMQSLTDHQK